MKRKPRAFASVVVSDRVQKAMNLPSAFALLPSVFPLLPQPLRAVALHGFAKGRYAIKHSPFAGCWCKGSLNAPKFLDSVQGVVVGKVT